MISIITINYNNKEGLIQTVESVQNQRYKDFEHIIIDGGSEDGSLDYIILKKDYFSFYVSEKDGGIYDAMNKGISVAKGEFLLFLNSGDYLFDNALESALLNIDSHKTKDIFIFNTIYLENGKLEFGRFQKFDLLFLMNGMVNHQNIIYSKRCFLEFQYDTKLKICADFEHLLKVILLDFQYIQFNEFLSIFDYSGLSSRNIEPLKKERVKIKENLISQNISLVLIEASENRSTIERLRKSRLLKVLQTLGFFKFI